MSCVPEKKLLGWQFQMEGGLLNLDLWQSIAEKIALILGKGQCFLERGQLNLG